MRRETPRGRRAAIMIAVLLGTLAALTLAPAGAGAAGVLDGPAAVSAARVERFWTPARMANAVPLEMSLDRHGHPNVFPGQPETAFARASNALVRTPELAPFAVNGRVFVRQGQLEGFCSGTAIDSPSRRLVLTAGHCVNSGPQEGGRAGVWSQFLEFVPAYTDGVGPLGSFVLDGRPKALPQWVKAGNPDFDMGAFLTKPNAERVNVADAVGGGAKIVYDLSRHQEFTSYGYPGETKRMRTCPSAYAGDDPQTYPFPGPPTLAIDCRWSPGSSGGAWTIGEGLEIDGITTYLHLENKQQAYGPYFSKVNVGRLVNGL
jgi:hypothetical protein